MSALTLPLPLALRKSPRRLRVDREDYDVAVEFIYPLIVAPQNRGLKVTFKIQLKIEDTGG